MRVAPLFLSLSLLIILLQLPTESESIYAYAVKGIVKDIRLHPRKFLGGWFFKKGFIILKLHLKKKLLKKLLLKKFLKKLLFLGRKKRSVLFPEDGQIDSHRQSHTNIASNNNYYDLSFDEDLPTLGLSQQDLQHLRYMTPDLRHEYNREVEQLEGSASTNVQRQEEMKDYFQMAREFDSSSCIQRSICDIVNLNGTRSASLFEKQVLEYYSSPLVAQYLKPDHLSHQTDSERIYSEAAMVGKRNRGDGGRACSIEFSRCQGAEALSSFINEVFTPEMCSGDI